MNTNKILVIEDEIGIAESLEVLLEANDYPTYIANNGSDGLNLLAKHYNEICLILCDVNLPDISGHDVLKVVRNNGNHYNIPFIFLTAFADDKDIREGMNMGADDYLTKPFSIKDLIQTIKSRISIHENTNSKNQQALKTKWNEIFTNNFRQEFYTPLNSLLNCINIAMSTKENIDKYELSLLLESINKSGFRLYRNARNLLLNTIISNKELPEFCTSTDNISFYSIVTTVVNKYYQHDNKPQIDLSIHSTLWTIPSCSQDLMEVVITELIDNAIKFNSSKNNPTAIIKKLPNGTECFCITNEIINDFEFNEDRIIPFKKFRLDNSLNGLGLGLFIVKELISSMKLHLEFEINESLFTVKVLLPTTTT